MFTQLSSICFIFLFIFVNCETNDLLTSTTSYSSSSSSSDKVESQSEGNTEESVTEIQVENVGNESVQVETAAGEEHLEIITTPVNEADNATINEISMEDDVNKVTTTEIPEQSVTKTEPFYHKSIQNIVKVVESKILDIAPEYEVVTHTSNPYKEMNNDSETKLDRLSDQIRAIINHYQTYGEVTVPNSDVPDPMDIPDVKKNFGGSPTTFTAMQMYGLSNFTIAHVNTDLNKMQIYVLVLMKRLEIIGNYSIRSWLGRSAGPFNVTLLDVETEGAAELKKDENGTLQASDSELDMGFRDAIVDFKNLGLVGSILQSVLASAAPVLFDAIKPVVLKEINKSIREDLNGKLKKVGDRMAVTGSRPPLDAAEEEGRSYIRENGYDPYHIKDFAFRQNVFAINITEFILEGLSKFRRVGEAILSMDEGTIQIGSHVAALDLTGSCKWAIGVGKSFKREGYTNFTVDHLQVRAFVNQSIDVKNKPKLDKLDINLGKIRVKMVGAGSFDLVVEVMVNSLPDLIRHILVDAVEEPLKYKIQQILNKIEPEIVLQKSLPELDNLGL